MMDDPNYKYKWTAGAAHIMSDAQPPIDDIGVIELGGSELFFTESLLKLTRSLARAMIVPICLGASGTDIIYKDVRGVGWGKMYEEAPDVHGYPRDPIYSSCMTNQASPHEWKFQNCDIKSMKEGNKWECDKTNPPPSYKQGHKEECMKLFELAKKIEDKENPPKTIGDRINKVDKIYSEYEETSLECVNPDLLAKSGWCYLKDFPEKYEPNWDKTRKAWGICSPSCDPKLVLV